MNNPLISIIIPVYNGAKYLAAALKSVERQDYQPREVIVVDDGSTDVTPEVMRAFPEVRYIRQENQGNAAARNRGIKESRGELIAFLDQDDIWSPDKLSVQVNHLKANLDIQYNIGRRRFFLEPGSEMPRWFNPKLLEGDYVSYCPGALVARRSIFETVGYFNVKLATTSDVDWFAKAKEKNMPMAELPNMVLLKRVHHSAQSGSGSYHSELLKILNSQTKRQKDDASVSVIIPLYNCEKYIMETLQSALSQTHKPKEIIVIDDGSKDGGAEIVKRFGPPVFYYHQENSGIGAARNSGVQKASGSLLSFLDQDDLWPEDKLEKQVGIFKTDSEIDMVFGYAQNFYSPDITVEDRRRLSAPLGKMPGYIAGTMMIRRSAFDRVGNFIIGIGAGEFIDWYARAKATGLRSKILEDIFLKRRIHNTSQASAQINVNLDYLRVLKASIDRKKRNSNG